jgi:type I restriction enzyme S subunit
MAVDIDFFSYLFKSHDYIHALRSTANFIRDGQDLNFNNFSLIDLPLIPIEEQKAIARFLGHVDRRVRRYIRAKRRLIALLNEQKQAVIHQAVTRGLDPDVPLKPSGIDWLGDVPENWDAMPLRRIGRFRKGSGGTKEDDVAQGVPCIRYGHLYMYFDHVIDTPKAYISRKRAAEYAKVHRGEVIFAASGEDMEEIGKSAAVAMDGEVCCGGDAIIFRPWLRIDAKFLGYACDCWHAARQKASLGRGTTVKHIYEDQLKKVVIAIPPREEQTAIVADVEKAIERGDNAIATAERESLLIREYRIRLVADVVTGKLDVRDAAMRLPEVVGDFEENGDAAVEDEPPLGDDELDAVLEEAEA